MDTTALDEAKYVSLTSYRKDGTAVSLPIWLAGSAGTYEMVTDLGSYKVGRIRNDPRVQLRVCDMRGRVEPGSTVYDGTAEIVDGAEGDVIDRRITDKYGLTGRLLVLPSRIKALITRTPIEHVGIRVTLTAT